MSTTDGLVCSSMDDCDFVVLKYRAETGGSVSVLDDCAATVERSNHALPGLLGRLSMY